MHSNLISTSVSATGKAALFLGVLCSFLVRTGHCQENREPAPASKAMAASFVTSMAVLDESHKLGPGDQISFRVIEDEDPPRLLTVTDSGEMEVPYLGRLKAAGKTCKAIAYEIKGALEKEYYIQASVILGLDVIAPAAPIAIASRGTIYLMGQVRAQGPQEIPANQTYTVSKAILRAGGFAEYANKRKVKLIRKVDGKMEKETKIVDVVEVLEKGKTEKDVVVEPDDIIVVPERWINF